MQRRNGILYNVKHKPFTLVRIKSPRTRFSSSKSRPCANQTFFGEATRPSFAPEASNRREDVYVYHAKNRSNACHRNWYNLPSSRMSRAHMCAGRHVLQAPPLARRASTLSKNLSTSFDAIWRKLVLMTVPREKERRRKREGKFISSFSCSSASSYLYLSLEYVAHHSFQSPVAAIGPLGPRNPRVPPLSTDYERISRIRPTRLNSRPRGVP